METTETVITTAPVLRKYFYESVVIALSSAVVYLILLYNDLNKFIRTDMAKQSIEQTRAIERNTDALNIFIIRNSKTQ